MTVLVPGRKSVLPLDRKWFTPLSTIGELFMPDRAMKICFTLEDTVRAPGVKVQDETAIPEGVYEMVLSYSNKFKALMPLLLNVPMFDGIRFHKGNTARDSRGCIITGSIYEPKVNPNMVTGSAQAYDNLRLYVDPLFQNGKVFVDIKNVRGPSPASDMAVA